MKPLVEDSFLGHLETLRWHLLRSLIVIFIASIAWFLAKEILFKHLILGPTKIDFWTYTQFCRLGQVFQIQKFCLQQFPFLLQSRQLTGQFLMHVAASAAAGLISTSPYIIWEAWHFIKPGLLKSEKKQTRAAAFFITVLFFTGILFGYFILSPIALYFLAHYQVDSSIQNYFDISSYVSTLLTLTLGCGLVFQMPAISYFLTRARLIKPQLLRSYRKYAIVILLVLAAVITPPDPFSQIILVIPLYLLYQSSVWISTWAEPK
ncbi:MAG: twin-arginine translocase subunit TatC [Cytophagales bacterium]|nr:twin-arginine translocase subunit TatC [Cytophagales bacterium]